MVKKIVIAAMFGLLLGLWSTSAASAPLAEVGCDGVSYLNGGIGEDEIAQMTARARDFDFKLVLAEKTGAYLADVGVVVFAGKNRKVLEILSAGPIVLAKLPPGKYRVEAIFNGEVRQRAFRISAGRHTNLTLRW